MAVGQLSISIVTPWHDHTELAADYLNAVESETCCKDEIIVVDNASDPPLPFGKLRSERNLGFVGGSNFGLDAAQGDAVLFLNNDIYALYFGWLEDIRDALEPGVLVGPLRTGQHANVDGHHLPYIDGWCLAGMRKDLLSLGGFDEGLAEPAYYSDNLLCLEARAAGMTLRDVRPGLHHKLNATAGPASDERVRAATTVNRARYEARVRELLVTA